MIEINLNRWVSRTTVNLHFEKKFFYNLALILLFIWWVAIIASHYPDKWVVDCRHVGQGNKALVYLGRYLYRGVIQEKDILTCHNGQVTFRYQDSKTKKYQTKTISAIKFLWQVFQHILPRGFRRARDYGFLHHNSKKLIQLIQLLFKINPKAWIAKIKKRAQMVCACCGHKMEIVKTQIPVNFFPDKKPPIGVMK
nr:transposase [sulfur-oxidizing endosymbiont of Gigantopelta aegis]